MAAICAVFFDFGGTLWTYQLVVQFRRESAARLAGLCGVESLEEAVAAYTAGVVQATREFMPRPFYLHRDLFAAAMKHAAAELSKELGDEDAYAQADWATGTLRERISPRPGLHETLQELRRRSLHVGGVSNSDIDDFTTMIDALDVRHLFDSLLCSEEARSCKPDKGIFLEALGRAGCSPEEVLFVGDSPNADIAGAEQVGMRALLIEERSDLAFDRGTAREGQAVIRELPELLDYLDTLTPSG